METPLAKSSVRLSLRVLGGFSLERESLPCDLAYEKGRALLAYLALEPGRAYSRKVLAAMLWPDLDRDAALTNLRQVLRNLRQTVNVVGLTAPALHIDRESVRIEPSAELDIDVCAFLARQPECRQTPSPARCTPCLTQMETLAERYRGEFMAGFSLPDCPEYEEWLQVHREELHLRALALLKHLSECHEHSGSYKKSLLFARQFMELDPWNEDGLRRAMRLFALNGFSSRAISAYERCRLTLKSELGLLPSEETHALLERIRRGELAPPTERPARQLEAQRRQVTVLYCELSSVGVDDLDEALDRLQTLQAQCSEIIRQHSGFLAQERGGSLLAYFSYPQATENAPRLAVRAAQAITRTTSPGLELRVGIHTGLVISSDLLVPDALGATSGLAVRLRQLVEPGEVAISSATQRLIAGYFECTSLGLRQLRGIERPLDVFRVDRESGAENRLEAACTLSPLVGRQREMAFLQANWQDVRSGVRRIVLLSGEAGIGKSRLVLTLKETLDELAGRAHERRERVEFRELRCVQEHSQSPWHPLVALFKRLLSFAPNDAPATRFGKLVKFVAGHAALSDPDAVPLLARMLTLPLQPPYGEASAAPAQQRDRTMAILLDCLNGLAQKQPVLLVIEDLHWADPSTLEFLDRLVAGESTVPLFVLLTARPAFASPWDERRVRTLTLNALNTAETGALIAARAPNIAADMLRRIVERSDGIPLFAEELAREAAISDAPAIPSTLHDLLAARLDGMGEAGTIAQCAATLGRKFSIRVLHQLARFDEATLHRLLGQLQDAGILEGETGGLFNFRHALIRDAAYQSQTRTEREARHRLAASELKARGIDARPEQLAQHWAAGGEIRKAIDCWNEAGKLASQHAACREAILHFRCGLQLVETLPAGQERWQLELDLQIGLGAAAYSAHGYASTEGAEAYARAMALCARSEARPDLFRSAWGLWASASSRLGYAGALDLAWQLLDIARQCGDTVLTQQGHFAVADTLYWQGEFVTASEHLQRLGSLYDASEHDRHVAAFGEDAGITGASYTSWNLWFLGFPDQARQASARAVALARRHRHPFSLAYALAFAAILHCRLRQPGKVLELAQETLDLATTCNFPLWQIAARLAQGWAQAMQHQGDGIDTLRQCVEATRAAMSGVTLLALEPLLEAYAGRGCFIAALRLSEEALALGKDIGDHHIEAELHRLRGESILGLGQDIGRTFKPAGRLEAEDCFHQALAISRRQQSKSLELRAAMSMARLWQKNGKGEDARRLLEAVYNGFTEGFDMPDLVNARQLLRHF